MRRSSCVVAPLLASMAVALLTGCRSAEMERCVDEQNHVVDPAFCKNLPQNGTQTLTGVTSTTGSAPHVYRYYYGGGGSYYSGSAATGGSYSPASGHSYSTTGGSSFGTSRGGFGSSFSSGGE